MATMTIHADEQFASCLREYAASVGKSVNQTIKDVFAPILGLAPEELPKKNPWGRFVGALPDLDAARWASDVESMRTVDAELWK